MAGWNMKSGELCSDEYDQDQFWNILKNVFSDNAKKTTTYKFCFFKGLIDNIFKFDSNLEIDYRTVFETVAEIYWNLIFVHNINQFLPNKQSNKSKIEAIVDDIVVKYRIVPSTTYDFLDTTAKEELIKLVTKETSRYVVGAFYFDTKGKFYAFSKEDKKIRLHKCAYNYLIKHKYIVEKLNYYEWLKFLEKVNVKENSFALASKLDSSNKRTSLKAYKDLLHNNGEEQCFYCGRALKENKTHVDHFVPWSYVKSDQLWNLVLSCDKCNLKKSNSLPRMAYLEKLLDRNSNLMRSDDVSIKIEYSSYSKDKLLLIFNAASHNGLDVDWTA